MTKEAKTVSIASLNAVAAGDAAFEFEYIDTLGNPTGIFFKVLGSQSEKVTKETNALINARRRQEAVRLAQVGNRRPQDAVTPVEDDITFGQRLAAIRVVGWSGITEEYSPELALKLCQTNADISSQVLDRSNEVGNFIKASPTG